jgi:hypothetical protein
MQGRKEEGKKGSHERKEGGKAGREREKEGTKEGTMEPWCDTLLHAVYPRNGRHVHLNLVAVVVVAVVV